MYSVSHHTAKIALADYAANYRDAEKFIVYCKACKRYGACWSCPPFDFDVEKCLSSYETALIIGTKIVLSAEVIRENTGWTRCTATTYRIIGEVRSDLDAKLLELESKFPGGRAFFAGTCQICPADKCTRIQGEPCVAPSRIRPSLESFGFDIVKTADELLNIEMKWSRDGVLPEYFTPVSGFFSNGDAEELIECVF